MGAKVLSTYRGYTASGINNRASNTCTHSVSGIAVGCTDVMLSKVRTVLGASGYSLYDLCRHVNVNHYSGFTPTLVDYANDGTASGVVTFTNPTVCKLGDFAGYNHSAIDPGWSYASGGRNVNVVNGQQAEIWCDCVIGEINYPNAVDVCFTLWGNSNLTDFIGYDRAALSGLQDYVNLTYTTPSGITSNVTYYSAIFICDDTSSSFQSNCSQVLGMVPNTTIVPVNLVVTSGSSVTFQNKGNWGIDPDSSAVSAYVNAADGLLTIDDIWNSVDPDDDNLYITVQITGTGVVYGSFVIWQSSVDGTYTTNYSIGTKTHQCGNGSAVNLADWLITISWSTES